MRRRLVLAIAGVAAAAVVVFAVPLGLALSRSYSGEELLRLQREASAVTRRVEANPPGGDPVELPRLRGTLAVYDVHGDRIGGRGPERGDALVRTALRTAAEADRSGDHRLFAAVPLIENERVAGVVWTMRDDAVVDHRTFQAWLTIAGLAAVLLAAATAAAAVLGGHLAAPLERLAVAARRLGDGDFTVRTERAAVPEVDAVGAALDATAERLDTLLARERAFSADASHQLRTPLAALRIEIEALELRGGPAPELHAALRQVDRLQATIDTLLAVARDVAHADARADLGALLREDESRWRGGLARDGRALDVRLQAADTTAAASPGVVAEILDVLVANAVHHGAGAVTVTVREADRWLAVDVCDHGRGFAGDPAAAFARRAGRAGRGGDRDGHGIGLALARSLADAEGGSLTVTRAAPEPVLTLLLPRPVVASPRPAGAAAD